MDDETDVTQTDVNEKNEQNIADDKHLTFDDMLAGNKDYQAEFDRKVAKALNTAKATIDHTFLMWSIIFIYILLLRGDTSIIQHVFAITQLSTCALFQSI